MRWLLVVLLVSVGALVYVASALTRHVLRQRNARPQESTQKELEAESGAPTGHDTEDPGA